MLVGLTVYFFGDFAILGKTLKNGAAFMNVARVSHNGQITIPIEIRRLLKIKTGDKMIFSQRDNGEIVVNNTALIAIDEAQAAVAGSTYSEDEILADVMALRYGGHSA